MAHEDIIARRYARGLAEYAGETSSVDAVRRDLKLLADIVDSHSGSLHMPEFLGFLLSPVVAQAEKAAAAEKILAGLGITSPAADFMKVLLAHNRIGLLPRISRAFSEIAGAITGEVTAEVHTARPLTAAQTESLVRALSAAFGCTVHLHQRVEPGLLAGARIIAGGRTFDGSVLGRLNQLRHRLMTCGEADIETLEAAESAGAP